MRDFSFVISFCYMIDEIDEQKNRDIELFQKFYDFATTIIYQKIATNTNMKEKLHDFRLEINGVTNTMKFIFDIYLIIRKRF